MTTTARELAEKLVKNFELVHFIEDIPDNHPISIDLVSRIEIAINEAFERGRESVLSRVPDEDTLMTWIRIKLDKDGYRPNEFEVKNFILAKLKEPT